MSTIWQFLIPPNLLALGAIFLILAFAVVWVDPGHYKAAIIFALIGGFGVGGAAGGWLGQFLYGSVITIAGTAGQLTAQAVGVAVSIVFFAVLALVVRRWFAKGIPGKGKWYKRLALQIPVLLLVASLGTALSGVPYLYQLADTSWSTVAGFANALIAD